MSRRDKTGKVKLYPWKCRNCGKVAVRADVVDHPVRVEYDGRVYHFVAKGLKAPRCQECGTVFPDAEANRQITDEFRRQARLLTPQQIRSKRESLELTQKKFAAMLGIAEATLSRWETGAQIQQRSLDNYLRLVFAFPVVRRALLNGEFPQAARVRRSS